MQILFGQAYHLRFDPKLWAGQRPYPPLGTLYAASVARAAGHDVALADSTLAVDLNHWREALDRQSPDLAVLYEDNFNYLSKMCLGRMREAAAEMIHTACSRGIDVLVCGSDASDDPAHYLHAGAKAVLLGEGEATLAECLRALSQGEKAWHPHEITGLAYLDAEGAVQTSGKRPNIRDLDGLPMPAWDLINFDRYRQIWHKAHGHFSVNMVTTRGCPFHCNWCAKPIWGQRYNARSPEDVAEELAWLHQHVRPDHIWFMDDIFGLKPGWAARFAEAAKARGCITPFKALSRADLLLRDGEVEALARAGCQTIWIGAESGSQRILDAMEKGTTVEEIERASRELRNAGIRVGHFIQFGYPGEDRQAIADTFGLVRRVLPDELGISVSYPLPGTPFYERVKEQLGSKQHWSDSDDLAMLYEGPFSTAFYRKLHRLVHVDLWIHKTMHSFKDKLARRRPWTKDDLQWLLRLPFYLLRMGWLNIQVMRLGRLQDGRVEPIAPLLDRTAAATPSHSLDNAREAAE